MATAKKQQKTEAVKKVSNPKTMTGVVVSDKMDKTVVVSVTRYEKHPKYQKFHKISKKYKVHCPDEKPAVGATISIKECRPISKDKHFVINA